MSLGSRDACALVTHWPVAPAWPPLTLLPYRDHRHLTLSRCTLIPFAFSQNSHHSPRGPSQKPWCPLSSSVCFPKCPSTLTVSLHSHHHLAGSGDLDLSSGPLSLTALLTFVWNSSDSLLVLRPERALGIECGFCLVMV